MIPLTLFTADYRVPGSTIYINPLQIATINPFKQRAIMSAENIYKPISERPQCDVTELHVVAAGRYIVEETPEEILALIDGAS